MNYEDWRRAPTSDDWYQANATIRRLKTMVKNLKTKLAAAQGKVKPTQHHRFPKRR